MPEVQNILEQTVQMCLQIYNWNINSVALTFLPYFSFQILSPVT